nr:5-deoxy-glucuronate isomerase [Actinopolymorpha alba]
MWSLQLTPKQAGWAYSGLRVLDLPAGASHAFSTGEEEMVVLPLAGQGVRVECDGAAFELAGRTSVFAGVSDFAYVPRDAEVTVRAPHGAKLALPSARCNQRLTARYGPADRVPVELRGAGQCSREVHNFCAAGVFEADKLIAVEVLTPGGNWSSYPPHKHDEDRPGTECPLEEIYYFEVADGPHGPGVAYQRVYGTPQRPIDVLAEVRSGDVVTIPHGWHGPSMAVPGYDLYYLNVMAGPNPDRAWLICDDPAHGWIRETWKDQPVDPRLPMTRSGGH